ncbi:MAG: hypothetical protein WCJ57_01140 [Candidatus Falkowbacteria bacterium]
MGPSIFHQFPAIDGYVLGALGYTEDLSKKFYENQKNDEARRTLFRKNDPTPKDYNILNDLDLLTLFSGRYGKGILCCRTR